MSLCKDPMSSSSTSTTLYDEITPDVMLYVTEAGEKRAAVAVSSSSIDCNTRPSPLSTQCNHDDDDKDDYPSSFLPRATKRSRTVEYHHQYDVMMMYTTNGNMPLLLSSSASLPEDEEKETTTTTTNELLLSEKDHPSLLFFRNLRRIIMSARRIQRAVRSKLRFAYTKVYAAAFLTPNVGLPLDFVRSSRWAS